MFWGRIPILALEGVALVVTRLKSMVTLGVTVWSIYSIVVLLSFIYSTGDFFSKFLWYLYWLARSHKMQLRQVQGSRKERGHKQILTPASEGSRASVWGSGWTHSESVFAYYSKDDRFLTVSSSWPIWLKGKHIALKNGGSISRQTQL